jgi:nicotinamidase-related amidase
MTADAQRRFSGRVVEDTMVASKGRLPIEESALVVIDLESLLPVAGQRGRWRRSTGRVFEEKVDRLIRGYRGAGLPVVFVLQADSEEPFKRWGCWFKVTRMALEERAEVMVVRTLDNPFTGTTLHRQLAARRVRRLAIAGLQTEACREAARLAADLGYDVDLVIEATLALPVASAEPAAAAPELRTARATSGPARSGVVHVTAVMDLVRELAAVRVASAS